MTTWATGDTLTSTWMNSVEKVLALGTFGATTSPRLTLAPNSTFDLASNLVATNLIFNGSISVSSAGKQWEGLSFRSVTSTNDGAAAYSTLIQSLHTATVTNGAFAYNNIGSLLASGGDGTGKISGHYTRVGTGATGNATFVAGTFGVTYDTGGTVGGLSSILNLDRSGTNVGTYPIGISVTSNNAGAKLGTGMYFDSTINITSCAYQYNMATGSTGNFLKQLDSSTNPLITVDSFGDIAFETTAHQIRNASTRYLYFPTNGDLALGKASAATGDTSGHIYIQSHAGAPTGVPAGISGYSALRYDTTAHKLYVYDGGWKATAALT